MEESLQRAPAAHRGPEPHAGVLRLIGAFKLFKAALLLLVGIGALRLLHRDLTDVADEWVRRLHLDPGSHALNAVLSRVLLMDARKLRFLGVVTFIYAALYATEGVGLLMARRWAEYLTVITTALLIPLEIYELVRRFTVVRVLVFMVNVAIVVYLIYRLRRTRSTRRSRA